MAFLHPDTKKSLEGKVLKFQNDVTRKLRLVSCAKEIMTSQFGTKTVDKMVVIDQESGEEKTFNANKSFMKALAKIDDQIEEGSTILVTPKEKSFEKDGNSIAYFDFFIQVDNVNKFS